MIIKNLGFEQYREIFYVNQILLRMVTNGMFQKLGEKFSIEPALLKAVAIVECGNDLRGFLDLTHPKILFEGHIFYRELKKSKPTVANRCLQSHPTICYENGTKEYYLGGFDEYDRYKEAYKVDPTCAMLATSWGFPQIMGFNYQYCGCASVKEFVDKMYESEEAQMELWYHFLYNQKLIPLLNKHDWEGFARKYNGLGQVNLYAQKLNNSYNNLKGKL